MSEGHIIEALIFYLELVALLTFHEFAHAWVAYLCGDDTARLQGRMSLNPIVHMDPIGTVVFPLIMAFSPAVGSYLIGWAKPVPVNLLRLRNPVRDDMLIAMAGPAMNLVLALILVIVARIVALFGYDDAVNVILNAAELSLLLCFFNLIPIPPLDGSHVLRGLIGMTWETYMQLCRYGIIGVYLVLRIPFVRDTLASVMDWTMNLFVSWLHFY